MSVYSLTGNVVERAAKVLREEGVRSFWFKLLREIGCYHRTLLRERLLEEPIPDITSRLPVTIDLLKKTEVNEYLAFHTEAEPLRIAERFNSGHWCFVARHEGQIISACWAATHRIWIPSLACEIYLTQDEVYIYDSFTKPNFRRQYVSLAIRTEMMRYFRAVSYRRIISAVVPQNPNSQASHKVGSRPFGMIGYIKIGPWRWNFYRTNKLNVSPRVNFPDIQQLLKHDSN